MKISELSQRIDSDAIRAWDIHDAARRREEAGESMILLSVGDPDALTPSAITEEAFRRAREGRTRYAPFAGEPGLREAFARRHEQCNGQTVSPDQVVVLAGAQNALFAAMLCVAEAGDEVVVPEPFYVTYDSVIRCAGATRVDLPLDPDRDFHFDASALKEKISARTVAVLLNTPHNPTGMVMNRDELEAVGSAARAHDLWVITDEVYADLTFDAPHQSISGLPEMGDRAITLGSMSKSHAMQGWRVGWVIAPPQLVEHITNLTTAMHYGLTSFVQDAAELALNSDLDEVRQMKQAYRERRDLICRRINQIPGLSCPWPEGSMFLLVDVRATGLDGEAFAWGLLDHGVSVVPGAGFGPSAAGHVRLSLTAPIEQLDEACNRIRRYADTLLSTEGPVNDHSGRA